MTEWVRLAELLISTRGATVKIFVRLGMELERDKPGTGLGLYIVRTLVRRLGGTIQVRDRDEGSGTVFESRLPGQRVKKVASATSASPPEEKAPAEMA